VNYYRNISDKKYILLTNSCRTALFLAYKSIGENGEVITSPLTCKVAIDPIYESGNRVVFADIKTGDLNLNSSDIELRITKDTKALQIIHFGGNSCEIDRIKAIAEKYNLIVIEDCAQSLGASYNGKLTGTNSDIACFSLIKNAYGIGGGVFATNSEIVYNTALKLNQEYKKNTPKLVVFRVIRNLIETKRRNEIVDFFHTYLMRMRGKKSSYTSVIYQLRKISNLEIKIASLQIKKYSSLHKKRRTIGCSYYKTLYQKGLLVNYKYNPEDSSFTKFYVYNPMLKSIRDISLLHEMGIEAMHLENKYMSPYQSKLCSNNEGLVNYNLVHDHIISIPLIESFNETDIAVVCNKLDFLINSSTN
jgi:dTDP-4-amino-4,6-dideoxygalactose transaminase